MNKKEALLEVLKGNIVYCKDINVVIDYSDFGGGFYSVGGADDGCDEYLEICKIPSDGSFILLNNE